MKIGLAVCILHNIGVMWGIQEPEDEDDGIDGDDDEVIVVDNNLHRATIRAMGEVVRDRMLRNMPPATRAEQRRLAQGQNRRN